MKISVITVVYNCRDTIAATLASVAGQTYPHVEHIVVDGASTDGTLDVLAAFRERIAVLISEPDRGPNEAQNKGLASATGDIVGFLNADDVYANADVLEKIAAAFAAADVDAVYGDLLYMGSSSPENLLRIWHAGNFSPRKLSWGWMPPSPTLYVRKRYYDELGGIDERYKIASDYHMTLRLFSMSGFRAVYIPEVFVKMRWGGRSNYSLKNIIRKSYDDYLALRETGVGGIGALLWKNISKIGQFFIK